MLTDTINDTTWAEANVSAAPIPLRVRPFSLARTRGVFVGAELVLLSAAVLEAVWKNGTYGASIVIACCAVAVYLKALDKSIVGASRSMFWSDLAGSLCWGTAAGMALLYFFPVLGSRTDAALAGLLPATLLPLIMRPVLQHLMIHKKLVESILIVGNGALAEKLHRALSTGRSTFGQERLLRFPGRSNESEGLADFSQLPELLARKRIARVVVAELDVQNRTRLAGILMAPRLNGLIVNDAADFYEQFFGKIWIDALSSEWFVYTSGFRKSRSSIIIKRCFDLLFAIVLLTLAAPLMLLLAVAIRLESAGPVLFRQVRVGLYGKTFVIYKFRSMREDAESDGGPAWAKEGDDRVTRLGHLLRKCHVDEIPQAFNVLLGEMSFVGPRPERPCFVDRLEREIPFYALRHSVKPGITGLAQVSYRYGASVTDSGEKLQYDLYYAKHGSHAFDAGILLKTVEMVLFGKGR